MGDAILTTFGLYISEKSEVNQSENTDQLIHKIHTRVIDTLAHSDAVPGLQADTFGLQKQRFLKLEDFSPKGCIGN